MPDANKPQMLSKGSLKTRILFIVILVAFAIGIAAQAFNIFETQAPFMKECNYTQETVKTNEFVTDKDQALAMLGKYTNTTRLTFDQYPIDYLCPDMQYFFENKATGEQFYVCKQGLLIKRSRDKCRYDFNFTVVSDSQNILRG
jgi:hypothetical protein